jgi:hypothetical protein
MHGNRVVVTAIIYKDETGVVGFVEEVTSANATGKTEGDVRNKLRRAVQRFYRSNRGNIARRMETRVNVRRERLAVEIEMPDIDGA